MYYSHLSKVVVLVLAGFFISAFTIKNDPYTKSFDVTDFSAIDVSLVGEIEYRQAPEFSVKVEGDEKIIEDLIVKVKENVLEISTEKDWKKQIFQKKKNSLRFEITSPSISRIVTYGAEDIHLTGKIETDQLIIDKGGAGSISAEDIAAGYIDISSSGVGSVELAGSVDSLDIRSSGVGKLNTEALKAKKVKVESRGVGGITLYASQVLFVDSKGIGNVTYYGRPENLNITKSGIGSVKEGEEE